MQGDASEIWLRFASDEKTAIIYVDTEKLRPLCSSHRQLQHFVFRRDTRILIPEPAVLINAHANDVGLHELQKTKCALGRNSAERDEFAWCLKRVPAKSETTTASVSSIKYQVDIAQEVWHQCSNTENSDPDGLTKAAVTQKSLHRFCGGEKRNYRSRFGGQHDAAFTHTCRLLCPSTLRFGGENANAARPMEF